MSAKIANNVDLVENMYKDMKKAVGRFSMNEFSGYITSNNVPIDEECSESYSGGVKVTGKVAREMNKTAEFMRNISNVLNEADQIMKIKNSKKKNRS